jgi:hypothetical protein
VAPHIRDTHLRRDDAAIWWHTLDTLDRSPRHPTRLLPAALAISSLAIAASMPLVWHHLHIPGSTFSLVDGFTADSWLVLVAAVAIGFAIRTGVTTPGLAGRWAITVLAFATANGMFIDYFDWSLRGVSLYVQPYYGPGYFLALAGVAPLVAAAILVWRAPD